MIADVGSNVVLQCAASDEADQFIWKKDGVTLPQSTTGTLSLLDIKLTDIGEYECIPNSGEDPHNTSVIQVDIRC